MCPNFFVSNIPQGCRPWDLANALRDFGEIAGAFIAKKKDKNGRTFGFVSFKDVRDLEALKNSLSKVKLGGNKLDINVARYAKENGHLRLAEGKSGKGVAGKKTGIDHSKGQMGGYNVTGSRPVNQGASFLDVLTNKTHAEKEDDVLVLDPATFSLAEDSERRAIGRVLGFQELNALKSSLSGAGIGGVSVQYLGGLYVLITMISGEGLASFLNDKDSWSRWFSMLQPWLGQAIPFERLAWINIRGVPPHLVSRDVFDQIGSRYGKVIQPSRFLESDGDISSDRLGILVDSGNSVNGILNLKWQDKKFKIWIIEENEQWFPDFLDEDEDSLAASSELGDVPESPAIGGGIDKEDGFPVSLM
ncbi:putative RNA recognition motif domain, nucleotide-binding alpha-beta plait domain superfamily [Helianthus debilis subsp. tardiflorus]